MIREINQAPEGRSDTPERPSGAWSLGSINTWGFRPRLQPDAAPRLNTVSTRSQFVADHFSNFPTSSVTAFTFVAVSWPSPTFRCNTFLPGSNTIA